MRYRITVGGDALQDLKPPFPVWIYHPSTVTTRSTDLVLPAIEGLPAEAELTPARIRAMSVAGKKGWIDLQNVSNGGSNPNNPVETEGTGPQVGDWICVEKQKLLQASDAVYYFQILGCEVRERSDGDPIGDVVEVYETAAHTVVDVRKRDGGTIVSIPLVDAFVEMDLPERRLIVSQFADFDI